MRRALTGGSPPHTRGIRVDIPDPAYVQGFTPAYAGNTHKSLINPAYQEVHPRIRGEYRSRTAFSRGALGSPPHTRGIPILRPCIRNITRFTPAYAGNTLT